MQAEFPQLRSVARLGYVLASVFFRRQGTLVFLEGFVVWKIIHVRSRLTLSCISILVGRSSSGRRGGRHLGCLNSRRDLVPDRSEELGS